MAWIQFFSFAAIAQTGGRIDSSAASARYRVIIPAMQMARRGHRINLDHIPYNAVGPYDADRIQADVVVFSKSVNPLNEELARSLRARGKHVVVDQCDNYFDHAESGDKYREHNITMCRLASRVVASTPKLAELIVQHTGITPTVISDPVEGPRGEARFAPHPSRVRLAWFGINREPLEQVLPSLGELARDIPLEVKVVTRQTPELMENLARFNAEFGERCVIRFEQWHSDAVWPALAACDMVIIPSGASDFFAAKSPNRMAEALWAGRYVIAHPVPSYEAFGDYAWIGADIADGIRQAVRAPQGILERIRNGQSYIQSHHSAWAIGNAWEDVLGVRPADRPVRIQLACGRRILNGYINIDSVDTPNDKRPDLICHLDKLDPFADASVDEVLSIHPMRMPGADVSRRVIRECRRVLKPGGRLVLECLNLDMANVQRTLMQEAGFIGFKATRVSGSSAAIRLTGEKLA